MSETTGTTPPIFIPNAGSSRTVMVGKNYFFIQILNAQVAYFGPVWQQVQGLAVVSKVDLSHKALGCVVRAIQQTRSIKRDQPEQLGISHNLVDVVPASMERVSISLDFILDRKNRFVTLSKIINEGGLFSAISLAPGAALVAQTLSKLSQQLIENFIPSEDQQPLLRFSSDFSLAGDGLKEGYYVILGSQDSNNPLPSPYELKSMAVRDKMLLINDRLVTRLSYVILNVQSVPARTRDASQGAAWDLKLSEAENKAHTLLNNPLATHDDKQKGWEDCLKLLTDAQTLLLSDPTYLRSEANAIIKSVYANCKDLVISQVRISGDLGTPNWIPDENMARDRLDIPVDEDLNATLDHYAEQVIESRRTLKAVGLR